MAAANVLPPTVSTTPAHRCDCRALSEAFSLPMTSVAPSARSPAPCSSARPVLATTSLGLGL
eukprot:scaffold46242_cov63-Phaeocystis_antarctica.AAC.1